MDTDTNQFSINEIDALDENDFAEMEQLPSDQSEKPITIVARSLSKYFKNKDEIIKAVDEVNFTFTEQQFITIVGPSGSGKSSLLYILGGLDQATAGELTIDGVDVRHLSEHEEHQFRRTKLGFVFQSFYLLSHLTALENVMLPMELAKELSSTEIRERAHELLLEVGISENRHNHRPTKLSGGQKQRVAIARALANNPKIILADEPTGNLDARTSTRIVQLLKRLATQGKTVIVVTHDRAITRVADVRLEMEDGKLRPMPKYVGTTPVVKKSSRINQAEKATTIVAEGVSKYFKQHNSVIKAVDDVSFTFTEQQFIAITGPSGSGKSTLLYVLAGLDKATQGELLVDDVNVTQLVGRKENAFRRRKLGFVFQSFHLLPHLTALENVILPMELLGGKSGEEMRERARTLLFQVGINEERHSYKPDKLSGGQKQRVAIARALANDPKIILADEPTGNLDTYNSNRVVEVLKSLADQGKTVIVVTHNKTIAREADICLEMIDGRIRGAGNTVVPVRPLITHKRKSKKR